MRRVAVQPLDSMRQIDQPTDHLSHGQDLMQTSRCSSSSPARRNEASKSVNYRASSRSSSVTAPVCFPPTPLVERSCSLTSARVERGFSASQATVLPANDFLS